MSNASGNTFDGEHRHEHDRRTRILQVVLALGLPAVVIGALFLAPYARDATLMPFGFDTPKYIWRTNVVAHDGLDALLTAAPEGFGVNAERPGYPIVVAVLGSVQDASPLTIAYVFPALMGIAVGMGAGGFAVGAMKESRWSFGVYAIGVGASVHIARTAVGYSDNLMFDALALAAAATALLAAFGRTSVWGPILLLVGAIAIHWSLTAVLCGLLLAVALAMLPRSIGEFRANGRLLSTPSSRLGTIVVGSLVAGFGLLAVGASLPEKVPTVGPKVVARKAQIFSAAFRPHIFLPAAALGAVALWWPRDRQRRFTLLFLVLWAGVGVAGLVALRLFNLAVPEYRAIGFALGIPVLSVAALVGLSRLGSATLGVPGAAAGVLVVAAGLAAGSWLAYEFWLSQKPAVQGYELAQVATAGRYLTDVGGDAPVVFVSDRRPVSIADHIVRAGLQAEQVPRALIYLGRTQNLLAGLPTERPGDDLFNKASRKTWASVEPILDRRPVVLYLGALNLRPPPDDEGFALTPDVSVIRGPSPSAAVDPSPVPSAPSVPRLVVLAGGSILLLAGVGLGFAASLVRAAWLERVALAPAFALAGLVIVGVTADRLGLGLVSGAPAVLLVTALVGWIPWVWVRFQVLRTRDRPDPS